MLRILKRYVNTTTKGLYFCRNRHSSAAILSVKCLDWQPAEFNGVDVNLDQLGENYNLDEFSVRLKGKSFVNKCVRFQCNKRFFFCVLQ